MIDLSKKYRTHDDEWLALSITREADLLYAVLRESRSTGVILGIFDLCGVPIRPGLTRLIEVRPKRKQWIFTETGGYRPLEPGEATLRCGEPRVFEYGLDVSVPVLKLEIREVED